jgi:hypothetical protein
MVSTIDAPVRMKGRLQALSLVSRLPDDLARATVELRVPTEALATASFIDQIVVSVLIERGATRLRIHTTSDLIGELAERSACSLAVEDRLTVVRE